MIKIQGSFVLLCNSVEQFYFATQCRQSELHVIFNSYSFHRQVKKELSYAFVLESSFKKGTVRKCLIVGNSDRFPASDCVIV